MRTAIVSTLLVALLAAFVAIWAMGRLGSTGTSANLSEAEQRTRAALTELAERLEDERIAREQLEAEVALLRSFVDLQAKAAATSASGDGEEAEAANGAVAMLDDTSVEQITAQVQRRSSSSNFDVGRLVSRGVSEGEAERMRTRWEKNELDKLYLADRASREGWLFTPRYGDESSGLDTELRSDSGDDRWDQMLFAAGRANRVVVSGVLGGSAADEVGIRKGDQILAYGDSRVFSPAELREATRGGESGGSVRIEILRDGRRETVYVPRGPIGTLIQHEKRDPEP